MHFHSIRKIDDFHPLPGFANMRNARSMCNIIRLWLLGCTLGHDICWCWFHAEVGQKETTHAGVNQQQLAFCKSNRLNLGGQQKKTRGFKKKIRVSRFTHCNHSCSQLFYLWLRDCFITQGMLDFQVSLPRISGTFRGPMQKHSLITGNQPK